MTSKRIKLLERKLREAQRELRLATLPTMDQQEELLLPEPGEELTRSQQIELLATDIEAWNDWYQRIDHRVNLEGARLVGVDLEGAYLVEADLRGADLQDTDLQNADLAVANLRGAVLKGSNLKGANLEGAVLEGADLRGANLDRASLRWANLRGATYSDATIFPRGFDPDTAGMRLA